MSRIATVAAALIIAALTVLVLVIHSRAAAKCEDAGIIGGRETHIIWVDNSHCKN